jgi:uncharacterized membrane protein
MSKNAIKPITLILVGNMLTVFNSIGNGWAPSVVAIFGFILFFIGLGQLKDEMDDTGKGAIKLLITAAIIGIVGLVISFIPLVGIVAGIIYLAAYIIELIAFIKLKKSTTLGETGKKGVNLLFIAIIVTLVGGVFGLLPLVGGIITKIISLAAFVLILFGWLKVQEDFIEKA